LSYLLDTNVISEALRAKPSRSVARWLETIPEERFYLSVLTLGEIRKGVEGLPPGARKARIQAWLEDLRGRFDDRILEIDARVSDVWGRMLAARKRPAAAIDSLIAATALTHELAVLTRNVANFEFEGLRVIDPFTSKAPGGHRD
jgi:predicted nucleic acid-binding protein